MDINKIVDYRFRITSILFISNPLIPFLYFINLIVLLFLFNNIFFVFIVFFMLMIESVYLLGREKAFQNYKYYFLIFIVLIIMNMVFIHRGQNVLFYLFDKAITLESIIYGVYNGMFLVSMLMVFNLLNEVVGTKGIVYIFSNVVPQISFLISFTLRWTNILNTKAKEYFEVQKLKKKNIKGKKLEKNIENLEFFIKNSLEEGFVVGEVLRTKSYGKYKRNNYKKFIFFLEDIIFIVIQVVLTIVLIYFFLNGTGSMDYYDNKKILLNSKDFLGILFYSVFLLLPIIIDFILKMRKKRSLWKY